MLSGNSILFSSRNQIKGLTTSAGLWTCGIIGLAVGAGLYTVTLIAFVALLCSLALFPQLEMLLKNRSNHFETSELKNKANLQDFVTTHRRLGLRIDDIESNPALSQFRIERILRLSHHPVRGAEKVQIPRRDHRSLSSLEYVHHIEEMT